MKKIIVTFLCLFPILALATCPELKGRQEFLREIMHVNETEASEKFASFCDENRKIIACETMKIPEKERKAITRKFLIGSKCGVVIDRKSDAETSVLYLIRPLP